MTKIIERISRNKLPNNPEKFEQEDLRCGDFQETNSNVAPSRF